MFVSKSQAPSSLAAALWHCRAILAILSLHFAAVYALCLSYDAPYHSTTGEKLIGLLSLQVPVALVILIVWRLLWGMICLRPARPISWFIDDVRGVIVDGPRMISGITAFLAITAFGSSFVVAKDLIATVHPFSWDPAFAALDRFLHGGMDPWKITHALFGTPFLTTTINALYHAWILLFYLAVFVACFNLTGSGRHKQFLVADMLVWSIGGNLLAMAFSSAGPVYYAAFGFGDTFAPLMAELRAFDQVLPVPALHVQDVLLHETGGAGISAMPSMHVASSVTMAFYAFSLSRVLGWVMTGFAAIIVVGSVHLGWHYAVDGYFSILLSVGLWALARTILRRFDN